MSSEEDTVADQYAQADFRGFGCGAQRFASRAAMGRGCEADPVGLSAAAAANHE